MPHRPLVSKIRCNNNNRPETAKRNRNYLVYIATREGVDLTDAGQMELIRPLKEDKNLSSEAADAIYAKYISERPGSTGLFGNINTSDVPAVGNYLAKLSGDGHNIYQHIISLAPEDALELGFYEKKNWAAFIRATVPDVAAQFDIPVDKLEWVAAFHNEKEHPHCHLMYWNKDSQIRSPYIHTSVQDRCRELLSKEMFKAEREQEVINKTIYRDALLDGLKEDMAEEMDYLKKQDSPTPGRIPNALLSSYGEKLRSLSASLPEQGRLMYKFLSPENKAQVDSFVDDILKSRPLYKEYENYLASVDRISRTYSASDKHIRTNHTIADEDIRKRAANIVLKCCKEIRDNSLFPDDADSGPDIFPDGSAFPDSVSGETLEPSPDDTTEDAFFPEDDEYLSSGEEISFTYDYSPAYKEAQKAIYDPDTKDIPKALKLLHSEAETRNVLAWLELAKLHERELVPDLSPKESSEKADHYYRLSLSGLNRLEAHNRDTSSPKSCFAYKLGKLYEKGNGTEQDLKKAALYYRRAADNGNKYAQFSLGNMYLREEIAPFTQENRTSLIRQGLDYLKSSSDAGFAYASYTYAKTCEKEAIEITDKELQEHYQKAFAGFSKMLEERRDDNLLYRIGTMYYDGKGVEADPEAAYRCFQEAAELKNANAYYALGKTCADPKSPHFEPDKATEYFQTAIDNGAEYARTALGDFYADKELPLYDPGKALEQYLAARESDIASASYKLGKLYADKDFADYNPETAGCYFTEALENGNTMAAYQIGILYEDKESSLYNPGQAVRYYNTAYEAGNKFAACRLGRIYSEPEGDFYSPDSALSCFLYAHEHGNTSGTYGLGCLYTNPDSPIYDAATGLSYLQEAADAGNIHAMAKLGNIYLWGRLGIDKNEKLGLDWLRLSAELGNEHAKASLRFYEDVQKDMAANLAIRAGYRCFHSIFASLVNERNRQDAYLSLKIYRNRSKEARIAELTRNGKYVEPDN